MPFELRDHTADVAVEATGTTLSETFAAVADGMVAAMCESVPEGGDRFEYSVTAESREALLFDYLDELVYQRDVRSVLPVDNEAAVTESSDEDPATESSDEDPVTESSSEHTAVESGDGWRVEASARGVPLDQVTAREIKAVTYSEMELKPMTEGWSAYVVFDV